MNLVASPLFRHGFPGPFSLRLELVMRNIRYSAMSRKALISDEISREQLRIAVLGNSLRLWHITGMFWIVVLLFAYLASDYPRTVLFVLAFIWLWRRGRRRVSGYK